MQTTEPTVDERDPQPYVAIPASPTLDELPGIIPTSLDTVFAWLAANDLEPAGPPFIRYRVIDMAGTSQVEIGVPTVERVDADGMLADELPAGRFASLVFTGDRDGVAANAALIAWAAQRGLEWDRWDDEAGDAFACRVEWLLDGPDDDPDPATWRTEVAIKLTSPGDSRPTSG